jgi:DNA repair exonuclease SbcCD ATPase subunit
MSLQIPDVDLNFDTLRQRMDNFVGRFDELVGSSRQQVFDSRTSYQKSMSEQKEMHKSLMIQLAQVNDQEEEYSKVRVRSQKDMEESRSAIAAYSSKKHEMVRNNDSVLEEIEHVRQSIARLRDQKAEQRLILSKQASLNTPELEFWQQILGTKIEAGLQEDFIRILFSQIDPNDADRAFWFVLDMRAHDYVLAECNPELDKATVDKILVDLNESRQINIFLRDMRRAFKAVI